MRPLKLLAASELPRGLLVSLDAGRTKNAESHGHAYLRLAGRPFEEGSFEAQVKLADVRGTESTLALALRVANPDAERGGDSGADGIPSR